MKRRVRSAKKISILLAVILFFSLININIQGVKGNTINYGEIKILEIEPGNQFYLQNSQWDIWSNNKKIKITQMPMTKFISMVDEISGQYDIVVIGRKNDGLKQMYSSSETYRDYTNPFSQKPDNLLYTYTSKNTGRIKKNDGNANIDGKKYVEYYSENDITKKRSDQIEKMISSGQLVYMDNSIFSETDKPIKDTNLYTLYKNRSEANLKKVNSSDINLDKIVKEYLDNIPQNKKRPQITSVITPNDDGSNSIGDLNKRKMNFTLNFGNDEVNKQFKIKLYLDINADGLYKDKELVKTDNIKLTSAKSYSFSYQLNKDFAGYLDWKIEVERYDDEIIKNDIISSSKFAKISTDKRTIRVLQIHPDTTYNDKLIYLNNYTGGDSGSVANFKNKFNGYLNSVNDYNLKIDCISANDFNRMADRKEAINGKYNMIIIGFADNYGYADSSNISNDFNDNAVNLLKDFIKTGQSVMFTHDTMTFDVLSNYQLKRGPKNLTQNFRDYLGQAVYKDPIRNNDESDLYVNGNEDDTNKNNNNIKHNDLSKNDAGKNSFGISLRGEDWASTKSKSVVKVNNAQINQYPFNLGNTINVSPTHTQWYQLNLEDPEVVPWYNLTGDNGGHNVDTGDSRNYYYTYSRGNLTYSGTGHSAEYGNNTNDEELKLFINTMVKAERGANHAPVIDSNITDNEEISVDDDFDFTASITDLDNDKVKINKIVVNERQLDNNSIKVNNKIYDGSKFEQGLPINVIVPKSYYSGKQDSYVAIRIESEDEQGAKATKEYSVIPRKVPQVMVSGDNHIECLVGDNKKTILSLKRVNDSSNKISDIRLNIKDYNKQLLDVKDVNNSEWRFIVIPKDKCNGEIIEAELSYKVDNVYKTKSIKIPVFSKWGKINVVAHDENNKTIGADITATIKCGDNNAGFSSAVLNSYNGSNYSWPNDQNKVTTNEYSLSLTGIPSVFKISKTMINDKAVNTDNETKKCSFSVNYQNPEVNVEYTIQYNKELPGAPQFNIEGPNPAERTVKYTDSEDYKTTEINYKIKPKEFNFIKNADNLDDPIDDVMFVVDLSKDMRDNARWSQLQNGVCNQVVGNDKLKKNYTEAGAIGFKYVSDNNGNKHTEVYVGDTKSNTSRINEVEFKKYSDNIKLINPLFDLGNKTNNDSNDACQNVFKSVYGNISQDDYSNNERNINSALREADNILSTKDNSRSKAIVMVLGGKVTYDESIISGLKEKGYKIITADLSNDNEAEGSNKNLHQLLGGMDKDYLKSTVDNGNTNNYVDNDMKNVGNRLIEGISGGSYTFKDVTMNFDLNDNFDFIPYTDNSHSNLKYTVNGSKLQITLPEVKYYITKDNKDGTYMHTPMKESFDVSFKIRPKAERYGALKFGKDNYLCYKRLNEGSSARHETIERTPVINVIRMEITHGVYKGKGIIVPSIETSPLEFAKGSMAAMAGSFDYCGQVKVDLVLKDNLTTDSQPKIYKQVQGKGDLVYVKDMSNYSAEIGNENFSENDKVFVLYNAKLPNAEGICHSIIEAGDVSKEAVIKASGELPDLY